MVLTDDIICDFRRIYDEFSDANKWPSKVVRRHMIEGDSATGGSVWGDFVLDDDTGYKKRGMYLYTAHLLASYYGDDASDPTKVEAAARLNIASKSVGDESVSYRITEMEKTTEDFLSTTIYGVQFRQLRDRLKATPMVAAPKCCIPMVF